MAWRSRKLPWSVGTCPASPGPRQSLEAEAAPGDVLLPAWLTHLRPDQARRERAHGRIPWQGQIRERRRNYARSGEGDQGTGLQESWPGHSCSEWESALEGARPSSQDRGRTRSFEKTPGGLSAKRGLGYQTMLSVVSGHHDYRRAACRHLRPISSCG